MASTKTRGRARWLKALAAGPATILPLLPSATCPLCATAYAGVLSSLGLGIVFRESVMLPLILVFLAVSVLSIAWSTRRHRRAGPVVAAIVGFLAIVAGRVLWALPAAIYFGIACVLLGSIWNLLAKKRAARASEIRNEPKPCDRCRGRVAARGVE